MKPKSIFKLSLISVALLGGYAYADDTSEELEEIHVTAEDQVKQSLGASVVTVKDIERRPATNDISELLRTQPGVNLTGNSASGQRGNKRQIDIRGMGPENTLILVDGKPVTSRNAERYGVRGERNTRGDSNWVPVEAIEKIEVLRGPAAARYGSGAMGGVVNIITKPVTNELHGSLTYYTKSPEDKDESKTYRVGFNLSGAIIKDVLSFRLYGNYNKTSADSVDINSVETGDNNSAGIEGVRNKDISGRLVWNVNPDHKLTLDAGFSRQGNIFNGDSQNSNAFSSSNAAINTALAESGAETARLYRQNYSLTHEGKYSFGESKSYISYDRTTNSSLPESLAGGPEGSYNSLDDYQNSVLKNLRASTEFYIPFHLGVEHMLTVGAEFVKSNLDDQRSVAPSYFDADTDGVSGVDNNDTVSEQTEWAVFVEDNIMLTDSTIVTPAVRFDYNSHSGSNVSPSLNFVQDLTDNLKLKGGLANAYKAPNLYQINPNYLLRTRGNGCPVDAPDGSCYFQGNADLKPETSFNKEIGLEYANQSGFLASVAYFHNAYRNKIISTGEYLGQTTGGNNVYRWGNANRAVIEGFEGNLTLPLSDRLHWVNNFTYMRRTINKDTGNPLSVIPKYTLNSSLNVLLTEDVDFNLTYTQYGRQTPSTNAETRSNSNNGMSDREIPSYAIWGINAGYNWNDNINIRVGINNLFDKRLYRANEGASTYNEPGRSYYATVKYSF